MKVNKNFPSVVLMVPFRGSLSREPYMPSKVPKSGESKTWKFWSQYVLQDCFAYVSLYIATHSSKWDLRTAVIKSMASLFTAYDRPNYQKLIGQHMNDLHNMPQEVLNHLRSGGFMVSVLGRPCHSIGIDEAHEMCINKDCKEFITRPSSDYINRLHYSYQ